MNWTSDYIGTVYNGETVFASKMAASGTLLGFNVWCYSSAGNFTIDLRKNGVTMLTTPLAFALNSIAEASPSVTSFAAGDILTLIVDNGTGDLYNAAASIIVEY